MLRCILNSEVISKTRWRKLKKRLYMAELPEWIYWGAPLLEREANADLVLKS